MSYRCPKCQDNEGYIVRGEDGADYYKPCECAEKKKVERAFKSSKITFEFQMKTFDSFDPFGRPKSIQDAFHCAKHYAENFDRIKGERKHSIALLGKAGSGKTHLLCAVANHLMVNKYIYDKDQRTPSVLYFPWVEGFNEIKDDLSLMEEKVNRMQKVDVLFIDDMWKGRKDPTPFQIEQAFAVVNYRYMNNKPLLVSSERDIDQMCDIDEAIGSRINEMCRDFRVILRGGKEFNYRLKEDS